MVEEYDPYLDLDTNQRVFDSVNPVYLAKAEEQSEATEDEK